MDPLLARDRWEIFATGLDHPECLAFDRAGTLFAGGEAGQIYRIDRTGQLTQIASLGSFVAGVAFDPTDQFLLACCPKSIYRLTKAGRHETFATRAGDHDLIAPNFGLFDRRGNYYLTDSGQWSKKNGRLLRFSPAGSATPLFPQGQFGYTNGLALSPNEQRLYMVESDTDSVHEFQLRPDGHADLIRTTNDVGRMPDGLALDAAGNLYCSCYASDEIWRISPNGAKTLFAHDRWAILLSRPTNLAFDPLEPNVIYAANLGRTTITRARLDPSTQGQPLANHHHP